jgi:hypothetical protein
MPLPHTNQEKILSLLTAAAVEEMSIDGRGGGLQILINRKLVNDGESGKIADSRQQIDKPNASLVVLVKKREKQSTFLPLLESKASIDR